MYDGFSKSCVLSKDLIKMQWISIAGQFREEFNVILSKGPRDLCTVSNIQMRQPPYEFTEATRNGWVRGNAK